jgi:transcriptional regulator with PAS, ATPase and Fis domain
MPPLRDRGDDVNLLADHFLHLFSMKFKKGFRGLSPEVRDLFLRYRWPGNVREIKNLLERIVLLEDAEVLEARHLPSEFLERSEAPAARRDVAPDEKKEGVRSIAGSGSHMRTLQEIEEEHILRVLARCNGNKSQAARVLGLSRQGLLDRLKRTSLLEKMPSFLTSQDS